MGTLVLGQSSPFIVRIQRQRFQQTESFLCIWPSEGEGVSDGAGGGLGAEVQWCGAAPARGTTSAVSCGKGRGPDEFSGFHPVGQVAEVHAGPSLFFQSGRTSSQSHRQWTRAPFSPRPKEVYF